MSAKLTFFNFSTALFHIRQKIAVQPPSFFGRSRIHERWPPLTCIRMQGELRNDQERAIDRRQGQVHLACRVAKDPQAGDAIGDEVRVLFSIAAGDTEHHNEAAADLANRSPLNCNLGVADTLNNCTH